MENLPDTLYEDYTQGSSSASLSSNLPLPGIHTICQWINDLKGRATDTELQHRVRFDSALHNLATNRNNCEVLPLLLWNSHCTVGILIQELAKVYPHISSPVFSPMMSIRLHNILLLFQCITRHPNTRSLFLKAKMPHYFYHLMDIPYTNQPLEYIRIGALRVIANMLKMPLDENVVGFLMDSGALSHCTRPIELGSTVSKTLGVCILYKILSIDEGLKYCCVLADRFFTIDGLLKHLITHLSSMDRPSPILFNLVVACYVKLSQKPRARDGLRRYKPVMLFDETFASLLAVNRFANNSRNQLIRNLEN